jgi:hypothetical protein
MKHDKNTQVIAVLAKWCKEHENTMETSYDVARGHLEIVEARAVVQAVNVIGDMLQEILDMTPQQLANNYLYSLPEDGWRPSLFPETGISCEMCNGPISVEDHAQCDICPDCLEGDEESEILTNQNQSK